MLYSPLSQAITHHHGLSDEESLLFVDQTHRGLWIILQGIEESGGTPDTRDLLNQFWHLVDQDPKQAAYLLIQCLMDFLFILYIDGYGLSLIHI